MFHDVTEGARRHSGAKVVWVLVHRQKNNLRLGARRFELPGRFDASQHWHGDVEQEEVRLKGGSLVDQGLPIANGFNHLKLRLEESCGNRQEVLVVIGQ